MVYNKYELLDINWLIYSIFLLFQQLIFIEKSFFVRGYIRPDIHPNGIQIKCKSSERTHKIKQHKRT